MFDVNNIRFDSKDVNSSLKKLKDPNNSYAILNLNPRYLDESKGVYSNFLEIKAPLMFVPYGISAYTEKRKDKDGNLVP